MDRLEAPSDCSSAEQCSLPLPAGRLQVLSRHPPRPAAADRLRSPIETRHTELDVRGRQFPTAELCQLQLLLSALDQRIRPSAVPDQDLPRMLFPYCAFHPSRKLQIP